jgi:hypothetical protein
MRYKIFSLVAAMALLASVGAAYAKDPAQASVGAADAKGPVETSIGAAHAKGPMKLTDAQLDKATAGDELSFLVGVSTADLGRLMAISNWALGWLNGVPQALPALTGTP